MKYIEAPAGYKIVNYDYDKTTSFEYVTITYLNIVPEITPEKDFGTPVKSIIKSDHTYGDYEPGEHVLARIDRNMSLFLGHNGTRELTTPEGYELLDYDYDKTDGFEFETYVYVNKVKVNTEDVNTFGKVLEEEQEQTLIYKQK